MPATPHIEKHFTATESVRDVVIGMADGLTVPFALAAGLSAAVTSTDVIVTAGLAEVVAGAIAMGLGGYLAARTDAEHYAAEEQREHHEIDQLREREIEEVEQIFREYGLAGDALKSVVGAVSANRQRWVDFMMRFELGLALERQLTANYTCRLQAVCAQLPAITIVGMAALLPKAGSMRW